MTLSTSEIIALSDKYLLGNVRRQKLAPVKGKGLLLWDAEGRQYYDFIAGIATCAFGHAPDFVADLLSKQARELVHISNLFYNEPLGKLAELLTRASGLDKAFFCNSGAEANEAALKMARKYGHDNFGPQRIGLISAQNSFHGRTMGAITATGQPKLHHGFEPLVPGFTYVPYGDIKALAQAMDDTICGVILEPIQGEGGVLPPPPDYLPKVSELCRERGVLLILDEIQTGLGRTGKDFAFRHFGIKPDILTLGKALGCGYPVGACLSTEKAGLALGPGSHSTTVGGAPLAMALGLELASRILNQDFLNEVEKKGHYFVKSLSSLITKHPQTVQGVRGLGLMLGLVLKKPSSPVSTSLLEKGFLVNATADTVLRFVPPLNVTEKEIDLLINALDQSLTEVYGDHS